ncbi:hypothetical protein EKK97_12975 [Billgrantia tianxiuensis]|uniref:Uncharacterized protein n=1 Tax=Billgrantia tianxiuensis TaxID=2497861 RepID=A0A6I6SIG7_9GAMM|nr:MULTISPECIES: hypothetical protein [Halomonas]MCE8031521.1 hypothetical protein [Halomonas sp. MCCC 1A11057]QHC50309.1 hypothetical protein EKK97_12975 [Halomonas tianxiuensis]
MSVIKGFMWCLAVLFVQLGLLRYIDLRVAAMPRLQDTPQEPGKELPSAEPADKEGEFGA